MTVAKALASSRRRRGAALMIAVLLIFAVAIFGAVMVGSMSSADIADSSLQGYSVEALYAAETGLERAAKQFATGTACNALGAGPVAVAAGRTFTTTFVSSTTGFGGAALSATQCRIQVVGAVTGTNVQRTVQAVLDYNLVGGPGANAGFDNPPGTGLPSRWAGGSYDYTGGPEPSASAPTSCNRAAYAVKTNTGNVPSSAAGTLGTNLTVPAGTVLTITFDYRVVQIASSKSNTCTTNTGAGAPCTPTSDAAFCFSMSDGGSTWNSTSLSAAVTGGAIGQAVTTCPDTQRPVATTQSSPGSYPSCSSRYDAGAYPTKGSVTITLPAAATISSLTYYIVNRSTGQPKEAWLDNIVITGNATGGAGIAEWRDCTVSACT